MTKTDDYKIVSLDMGLEIMGISDKELTDAIHNEEISFILTSKNEEYFYMKDINEYMKNRKSMRFSRIYESHTK